MEKKHFVLIIVMVTVVISTALYLRSRMRVDDQTNRDNSTIINPSNKIKNLSSENSKISSTSQQGNLSNKPSLTETNQEQTTATATPTAQDTTANWKKYRSDKFGFEFKYPAELKAISSGQNEEQNKLDRGEMISGTVVPSYDTITFSDSANKEQFHVEVFPVREDEISPDGFNGYSNNGVIMSGYLSLGSACDTRWMDSVSEKPTLVRKNGVSVLEVQIIAGGLSNGCYYFKNSGGNLIVFNISSFKQKSDFLNVFHLVGDKILPTLSLIK